MGSLSGWWPSSTGIGAITDSNFSNIIKDTASTTYAGGAVYIPTCGDSFPFVVSGDSSKIITIDLDYCTWFRPANTDTQPAGAGDFPNIVSLNKSFYNSINNDLNSSRIFQSWGAFSSSIDDITAQSKVYNNLSTNAPLLLSSNTNIYQNEALVIKTNSIEYITGILSNYNISKISNILTIDQERVSSDQILAAYNDAISNANKYITAVSKEENSWFGTKFTIPNTLFMMIAHTPDTSGETFLNQMRNQLWATPDICSSKCGFSYSKDTLTWSESTALSATASNYLTPTLVNHNNNFFHIAIAQGDTDSSDSFSNDIKSAISIIIENKFKLIQILAKANPDFIDPAVNVVVNQLLDDGTILQTSRSLEQQIANQLKAAIPEYAASDAVASASEAASAKETRKWAFEAAEGGYVSGFSTTLFNASLPQGQIPQFDCIVIAPTFSVVPEVYQCLMQKGPAWDYIVNNNLLTSEEKNRLKYRKYTFVYPIELLSINQLFIQGQGVSEQRKTALPAGGLPAKAIRYALPIQHQLSGLDFDVGLVPHFIWPDKNDVDRTPNIHVRLYNPIFPGKGFSHSLALRLLFVGMDLGTFLGAAAGASGGIIGALEGAAMGAAMRMYVVTYTDYRNTYKTLKSDFLWNPYRPTGSTSQGTAIHVMEPGLYYNKIATIPDEGKTLPADGIIKLIDSQAKDWSDESKIQTDQWGNNIATWAIWPSAWAKEKDDAAYLTRGFMSFNFNARVAKLGTNPDYSDIQDIDLSRYCAFIEFRFYAVDVSVNNISIDDFLKTIYGNSRKNEKAIDDLLGPWEVLFPTYGNAGPNHAGCGREFVWKYYVDNGYDDQTSDFEALRLQSNRIFSPILDNSYNSYDMSMFIDWFRGNSDAPRMNENDTIRNFGPRYLDAGALYFFVNARTYYIDKQNNELEKENISVIFDMENAIINMTGKISEKRIEYSQYYNDAFIKGFQDNNNILPILKTRATSLVKSNIQKNNMVYESSLSGSINAYEYINLDILQDDDGLDSFYIPAAVFNSGVVGEKTLANTLLGFTSSTSYFSTPNGLSNLIFIGGDANQYWNLTIKIGESKFEDSKTTLDSNNLVFLINIDYITISSQKISIAKNCLVELSKIQSNSDSFTIPIGPITQDMTTLNGGWILLSITAAIYANLTNNQVGAAIVQVFDIQIDHANTIGRIGLTGSFEPYIRSGRSIAWYRGLPAYGNGQNRLGTDAVFVTDATKNVYYTAGATESSFLAYIISPQFNVDMGDPFGWVLDGEYLNDPGYIRVSLLAAGATDSGKKSLAGASKEYGGIDVINIDDFTGEIRMRTISTRYSPSASSFVLSANGQNIVGDEAAIAESSNIGYEGYGLDSAGSLISITDNKTSPEHPKTSFFFRNNNRDTIAKNPDYPALYDINNIVLSHNPLSGQYKMIGRHVSGCFVVGDFIGDGNLSMPLKYVEGRLPKTTDQISNVSKEHGAINDDIFIDHYPYNVISKGFFDVRDGSNQNTSIDNSMIAVDYDIPSGKTRDGNLASLANLNAISTSTFGSDISRNGVEVSQGKPALIIDKFGGMYLFYSYSYNFNGNNISAECSPFLGRIYCIYSGNDGGDWTPPVCVLNLSPFNPSTDIFTKRYDTMISHIDTNNNSFNGGSYLEFDKTIKNIKNIGVLNSKEISDISLQDFDVIHDLGTQTFYISFWYGGFICYSFINSIIETIKEMWSKISKLSFRSALSQKHSVGVNYYSDIYNEKEASGYYKYTRLFWDPGYRPPIFIAAGPASELMNTSLTEPPAVNTNIDTIAVSILKSYGVSGPGNANLIAQPELFIYNNQYYNKYYSDYWKGTFPPYIYVKFGNKEYDIIQLKQKPIFKYMNVNNIDILFYNSNNSFAHIPLRSDGTLVSEGFPQVIGSI